MTIHPQLPRAVSETPNAATEVIDLSRVAASLLRHARLIAAIVVVCGLIGLISALSTPKTYFASTLVMLSPLKEQIVDRPQMTEDGPPDASMMASEIEELRSSNLAGQLVDKLGLVRDPQWNGALVRRFSPLGMIKDAIKSLAPGRTRAAPADRATAERQAVIQRVIGSLTIHRRDVSYGVEVGVTALRPDQAALMANTLAELYIEDKIDRRFDSARRANAWLAERLTALGGEVAKKEAAAEEYRAQGGLLAADGATLTESRIRETQSAVLVARTDLAEKTARLEQAEALLASGGSPDTIGEALNSSTIHALRTQEAEATRRQSELRDRYGEMHPERIKADNDRANIEAQIKAEVDRIMFSLKNEVQVSQARLDTVNQNLLSVQNELTRNNLALVHLHELEREANAARQVYESYLKRFQEISDQETLKTVDARVLTPASVPSWPAGPKVAMSTILWLAIGMMLGVGAALAREIVDDRLTDGEKAERRLGVPTAVSIPRLPRSVLRASAPSDYVVEQPASALAEAFRVLRSVVRHQVLEGAPIVALTSALPSEGKTTISLCLARVAALRGQRVLVIDCDLRRRGLNSLLSIAPEFGIEHVMGDGVDWRKALVRDACTNVDLILTKTGAFSTSAVFEADRLDKLLAEVRSAYDLVILDCPPVLEAADARPLAKAADATIFVVHSNKTPAGAVRNAVRQLQDSGASILGLALNCIDPRAPGRYSYSDSIYYREKHG